MKILFVTEYFPKTADCEIRGGVEARCFYVGKELVKRHQVTIISSWEPNTPRQQIIGGMNVIRCGPRTEYRQTGAIKERLTFMREAYRLGITLDLDLIEGTSFVSYLPAFYIAKATRTPSIAWYNDVWIGKWLKNVGISGLLGEILERIVISRNWSYFLANSRFTFNNLLRVGIKGDRLKLIPCGVDVKRCVAIEVEKENLPTVSCVSRLVKYKQVDVLIEAISEIRKQIPHIKLDIIGTGPELKNLRRMVKELLLDNNVAFLGFIPIHHEVLRTIKRSHVFCLPSIVEGFGIAVIEAMACNTPYVCSDIPALREVTNSGVGGLLFRKGDARELAQKILSLLRDKRLYNKSLKDGLELSEKYDWERIAKQTERFYEQIVPS